MQPIPHRLRRLIVVFGFLLQNVVFAGHAEAQGKKVNIAVTVNGEDAKGVASAAISIQGPDRTYTGRTDAEGKTSIAVPFIPRAEYWVTASKRGYESKDRLVVLGAAFDSGPAEAPIILKKKAASTVTIEVTVTGEDGQGIDGAALTLKGPEDTYTGRTDGNGKASIAVPFIAKAEYWISASKRGYASKDRLVILGAALESNPAEAPITLKKNAASTVSIEVSVNGEDGQGIGGAAIALKGPQGTYTGTTGGNGKASVGVPFIAKAEYRVTASKRDYEPAERLVLLDATLDATRSSNTVEAPPITMKKGPPRGGILVTFNITKAGGSIPVREAHIKVSDSAMVSNDWYLTTNNDGVAKVRLPEPGNYPFSISHDAFEPQSGQVQVSAGEDTKNIDIALKEKASDKTITVTVLAGDVKNGRAGNEPISGATVTGGEGNAVTDRKGMATLAVRPYSVDAGAELGWSELVDVTVSADGYKSQTRSVKLKQPRLGLPSTANETFILEAGEDKRADDTPIKLLVQVRDPIGPVPLAEVGIASLGKGETNGAGEKDFDSGNRGSEALAEMRKGLSIQVKRTDHKTYESTISSDLLQPSREVRRYSVTLEMDWTELTRAITFLEERIAAWKSEAQAIRSKAESVGALSTKCADATKRAEAALAEVKAARKTADARKPEDICKEAKELSDSIEKLKDKANEKEKALRAAVDEATNLAATCKSKGDGDTIRLKQRTAIGLTGELGKLEKEARVTNERLTALILKLADNGPNNQLQEGVDKIDRELTLIGKEAATADQDFDSTLNSSKALPGRKAELLQSLDQLRADHHVREYDSVLPPDLRRRLDNFEAVLRATGNDMSMSFLPYIDRTRLDTIKETVSRLQGYKNEAAKIVSDYKSGTCDVRPLDYLVSAIGSTVVGATIELGAAAELPAKAAACDAAAAAEEEVTVPDLASFDDVGGMKAATIQAGLVPALVATKATPPPGTKRLFAGQDPAAHTKAKKNSPLRIMLYQQVAQASPTPSPTPTPSAIAKATPSPSESDEVRVPDLSIFDGLVEMKAAASQVGLVPALAATKATPPPGATRLFAGQDPPAGSKAKRGSPLKILVYQKTAESAAASPTPTATPTATAIATTGNMPTLIGLTLDQAVTRLPGNMRIGSDEVGDKPPSPEKAFTIFYQDPGPGSNVDMRRPVTISVKRYGSAQAQVTSAARFDGAYSGSYSGADKGRVRFTVNGGSITISSPGSGSGTVSASGSASISGAGNDGNSSYSFSGSFSIDANGKATASGRWSGQQSGFKGSGTWSASR